MPDTGPLVRNPRLRRILLAQVPADLADWLDYVAIVALLAYTWQVDLRVFALLAVAMALPYVVIGPIAGVLVDRSGIRTVLILSNLGRAIGTACLALAPGWAALLTIVFLRNALDAFFTPAKQAAIQAVTAEADLMQANGISMAINQLAKIVAPAAGGALLAVVAPTQVFLLNAVVSLLAVAVLIGMAPIQRPHDAERMPVMAALREGWDEVMGKPVLRGALLLMALGYFGMFFYDTLIGPLTKALSFDQTQLGFALAAVGAGGVLGALILPLLRAEMRPFFWVALGAGLSAILVAVGGWIEISTFPIGLPVFLAAFFVIGMSSAMSVVPIRTILQTRTRPERMARVTAISEAANTIAMLVAPFLGAALAASRSVGWAFLAGAIIMALAAFYAVSLHLKHRERSQ